MVKDDVVEDTRRLDICFWIFAAINKKDLRKLLRKHLEERLLNGMNNLVYIENSFLATSILSDHEVIQKGT